MQPDTEEMSSGSIMMEEARVLHKSTGNTAFSRSEYLRRTS